MAPTPPPAARTCPFWSRTTAVVPRMLPRLGWADHEPNGRELAPFFTAVPLPLRRITATTEPRAMHSPTTASIQGRRERRNAGIRGATRAAQGAHLVPISVRAMHFGHTGLAPSDPLDLV